MIPVDGDLRGRIEEQCRLIGMASPVEYAEASVRLMVTMGERLDPRAVSGEIHAMFERYRYSQPQPHDMAAPRRRKERHG